jgi:MFS family permease
MAESANLPLPATSSATGNNSAWAPLGEPLFRSLWVAAVISYTGTWMQNVGAGWLMTELTVSPLMVSLVQAAATLPVFLVILPAGALADIVDRRRLLLLTQGWMVLASATLGIMTLTSCVGPWTVLLFTFLLGLGAVMNDPAWQAITPEVASGDQHASAVALNSVGFNVARAIGPALGGFVVASFGSGMAFLLNAVSFSGVIFFLYNWKRPQPHSWPTQRILPSIYDGIRHARNTPVVRSVLVRTATFSIGASSLLALLPLLARPHGPSGYGLLLGSFGLGALAGAGALPNLKRRLSVDGVVAFAILVFAVMVFAAGQAANFGVLCGVMFVAGTAWIGILACLNVAAQTMSPSSFRARALSCYLLVLQGGMAVGSALWGTLALRMGVPTSLTLASLALVAGMLTIRKHRLEASHLALAPSVVRD